MAISAVAPSLSCAHAFNFTILALLSAGFTASFAEFVRHAVEAMLSWAANVRLVQSHGLFVFTYRVEEGKQRVDGAAAESDVVVDAERPARI